MKIRLQKRRRKTIGYKNIGTPERDFWRPVIRYNGTPMYEKDIRILDKLFKSPLLTQGEKEYVNQIFEKVNAIENADDKNEIVLIPA